MSKKLGLVILMVACGVSAYAAWSYPTQLEADHLHYHAGFKVYIDDKLQDYSDYKYMNFVACSEHDTKKSKEEEQIEKAHLHDSVGDVVHVHRDESKWGDLFKNISVELPKDKSIKGFVNGVEVEDILDQPILADQSVIFVIGESSSSHANEVIPIEHIREVEAKSELCGSS
jgi:hypothetical protein